MNPLDEIVCPAISGKLKAKITIVKVRERMTCIPCVDPITNLSKKFTIVNKCAKADSFSFPTNPLITKLVCEPKFIEQALNQT